MLKTKIILCFLLFFCATSELFSQDSTFALSVEASGGYTTNINRIGDKFSKINLSPILRVLWKPNKLLNIGLETSFLNVASTKNDAYKKGDSITSFKAGIRAIPLILLFNMEISRFDFYGGIGVSYIRSQVEALGTSAISENYMYTYSFGLGYSYPITNRFEVGLTAHFYSFSKIDELTAGLLLNVTYDFYRW